MTSEVQFMGQRKVYTDSALEVEAKKVKWKSLSRIQPFATYWILQARILDLVAFTFSRESSQPRDGTQVSRIVGGFFTSWVTREAQE